MLFQNSPTLDYENDLLTLGDGTVLPSANIYWVAGVKANSLEGLPTDAYGPGNRLKVDALTKYPEAIIYLLLAIRP